MNPESALDLLREEMQNEETFLRVNAIHRIPILSVVIGPDNVKNQLLPYLNSTLSLETFSTRTTKCSSPSLRSWLD